jgi:hypothetical protein
MARSVEREMDSSARCSFLPIFKVIWAHFGSTIDSGINNGVLQASGPHLGQTVKSFHGIKSGGCLSAVGCIFKIF